MLDSQTATASGFTTSASQATEVWKILQATIIQITPVRLCVWDNIMAEIARLNVIAAEGILKRPKLFKSIFIDRWTAVFYCFLRKYATQRAVAVPEPTTRKKLHFHLS